MELVIDPQGQVRCLYDEAIDLTSLGSPVITRAGYVEPDELGLWHSELAPVGGPRLGPFSFRSQALAAEIEWLKRRWLTSQG